MQNRSEPSIKSTGLKSVFVLAFSIFLAETLVMIILNYFSPELPVLLEALVDSTLLMILITPALYFLTLRPLLRHIAEQRRIEQFKESVLKTVSHDLRNPLWAIAGNLEMILMGLYGEINNEKQKDIIQNAKENADHLTHTLTNLLDLSSLGEGRLKPHKKLIPINKLIRQSAGIFIGKALKKGIALKLNLPQKASEIFGDPDMLNEIFINLIGNAVKFTNKGFVEVSLNDHKDHVECTIEDSGRGIAQEDMGRIFNKFSQAGEPMKGQDRGLGIGLAIVKEIVDLHQGQIRVESQLEKGTKFILQLPKDLRRPTSEPCKDAERIVINLCQEGVAQAQGETSKPLNCWEVRCCGREPGGKNISELGVCPVTIDQTKNGTNQGKSGGRCCWRIAGTLCGGKVQGSWAQKLQNCLNCEFFKKVREEEKEKFTL